MIEWCTASIFTSSCTAFTIQYITMCLFYVGKIVSCMHGTSGIQLMRL